MRLTPQPVKHARKRNLRASHQPRRLRIHRCAVWPIEGSTDWPATRQRAKTTTDCYVCFTRQYRTGFGKPADGSPKNVL